MKSNTLIVEGMTCASCSSAVERIMKKQEGIHEASVNLTTKKLTVTYDESIIDIKKMIKLIENAGYNAREFIKEKVIIIPVEGMT